MKRDEKIADRRMVKYLPNALSLARLGLGIAFPFAAPTAQPWLIVAGAGTDLVDGWLARFLGADGPIGKYLDPIADKIFAVGVLIAVLRDGLVSPAGMALLLARDVAVVFGTITLAALGRRDVLARMTPSLLGKATTAAQLTYMLVLTWFRESVPLLFAVVAVVTAVAGLDYVRRGWLTAKRIGTAQSGPVLGQQPQ